MLRSDVTQTCVRSQRLLTDSRQLVSVSDGKVSFCFYETCREGVAAKTLRPGKYFIAVGLDLPSSSGPSKGSFAVIVDTAKDVAVVLSDDFQHPMTCGR